MTTLSIACPRSPPGRASFAFRGRILIFLRICGATRGVAHCPSGFQSMKTWGRGAIESRASAAGLGFDKDHAVSDDKKPSAGDPSRNKWAADNYRRGVEAIEKKNWDLAIEMFTTCCKLVTDNVVYRQLLRQTTRKKYNDNGTGAGMFGKAKLMGIRSRVSTAKKKADWAEVDRVTEEGLLINPWDAHLLADLGEAHVHLKSLDVAKEAYRLACMSDKTNKDFHRHLAEVLKDKAEFDEAAKVWEQVYKLDPLDGDARSQIASMHALKTTHKGGYDAAESTRDVATDTDKDKKRTAYDDYQTGGMTQSKGLAPGESMENDLRQAIRKEPENVANYTKLASYFRKNKKLEDAYETLSTALQVSGNSADVRELLEDVELDRMKFNIDLGKEKASRTNDPKIRENLAALAQELLKREIEILSARVERYPQDMSRKYELAIRFMRVQKWVQAIPLLQRAGQDPRLKGKALLALGRCFIYDKKLPLARGQLERAVPELEFNVDPEAYKEGHYWLGRVLEELGDRAGAETHYGDVLVVDYEYKDTRDRLEKLQGGASANAIE